MTITDVLTVDDPYIELVHTYDAETADMQDDLAAYAALSRQHTGSVLDVGCGTGRVAFDLARQGRMVIGVDTSAPMLQRARARSDREKEPASRIRWIQADITTLAIDDRFGLAIFAYNGFMHLLEQRQQIAALERIAAHLAPGGALAIDIANPIEMFRVEDTPGLVLERIFTDPDTSEQIMQQSLASVDRATQIMSVTWVYDRISADGLVHRHFAPIKVRYTLASEMTLLAERAGFDRVTIYGGYDFSPYDEDSPRLFVVAGRTGGA